MAIRLEQLLYLNGIKATQINNDLIRLVGMLVVDYKPSKKKARVRGSSYEKKVNSLEEIIRLCFDAPPKNPKYKQKTKNQKYPNNVKRKKERLFKEGKGHCFWCGVKLRRKTATLEHIIPLSRYGNCTKENRVLACWQCNHSRGSDMPELKQNNG